MSGPSNPDRPGFPRRFGAVVRRRWPVALVLVLLTLGATAAVLLLSDPVRRVEARLRLGEPPPVGGVSPNTQILGMFNLGGDPFANDLELMESRTIMERVVADAALTVRVDAPRGWHRDSLFYDVSTGRDTDESTWELTWTGSGGVVARMVAPTEDSLRAEGPTGSPLSFGGVSLVPRERREGMPASVEVKVLPFGEAVRRAGSAIAPERTRTEANVVEVAYDHTDPGLALQVVDATVRRFMQLRSDLHLRESSQAMDSLRNVSEKTARQLQEAERAMEAFQERSGLVSPEAQGEASVERYSTAIQELEGARLELEAVEEVLVRVEEAEQAGRAWTTLVSFPRFLENENVGQLLTRLTLLEEQRTELASRRTEENRELRVVLDQIEGLDRTLRSLARDYRTALREQIGGLEARVARMDSVLARIPGDAIQLGRHQREIRILSEVLVLTEQRLRQEELRQALTYANVQVIDPPALQHRPVWPRKKLGAAVGLLLAAGFGLAGIVVVERADRRVRTARALRSLIDAPVVAAPLLRSGRAGALDPDEARALSELAAREGEGGLVLAGVPGDDAAEVLASFLHEEDGESPRISVVPEVESFADGARASRGGVVVLVISAARVEEDVVVGAKGRIREAGGQIAAGVLVCASRREVAEAWS